MFLSEDMQNGNAQLCSSMRHLPKKQVPSPISCRAITATTSTHSGLARHFYGFHWTIGGLTKANVVDTIIVIVYRFTKYGNFVVLSHPYSQNEEQSKVIEEIAEEKTITEVNSD